jgi:predicted GNAT superfamily acetyltransferase
VSPADNIRIGPGGASDYPELLLLNDDAVPAVNSIPMQRLQHLHAQSAYLGVARDEHGAMAGFLLALAETAEYDSINFGYFKRRYPSFVYVDRIVVNARHRRAGVGAALYMDLSRQLPAGCPMITCEVNVRPPNPTSLAFHQRLGFEAVGEQDTENGSKRVCLMAWSLI